MRRDHPSRRQIVEEQIVVDKEPSMKIGSETRGADVQMSSFGIAKHAHVDAAVFAALLTLLTYVIKWCAGIEFRAFLFVLPTFLAIFMGFYIILHVVFLILWSRR